jgi:hypothetical protein
MAAARRLYVETAGAVCAASAQRTRSDRHQQERTWEEGQPFAIHRERLAALVFAPSLGQVRAKFSFTAAKELMPD